MKILNFKLPILLLSLILLVTYGCNTEEEMQIAEDEIISFEVNEYNNDLNEFAKAVNNAINSNIEFRKLIKEEAIKKFDGDYDVLLSHIINRNIAGGSTNSSNRSNYYSKGIIK